MSDTKFSLKGEENCCFCLFTVLKHKKMTCCKRWHTIILDAILM